MIASPSATALASDEPVSRVEPAPRPDAAPRDEPVSRADFSRDYAAARRHSAWVRWLKIGIPAGSLVAGLVVGLAAYFNPLNRIPGLTLGTVSLSGTKVVMENPRLQGFRKDARPYEVTAKAAFQDIRKPTVVELKEMTGRVGMGGGTGGTAELVSSGGVFDTSRELLELPQPIRITTSRGEEAELRSATVDFKAGTVLSKDAVRIATPNGTIEAEGIHIADNGSTVSFSGRVRTQFNRLKVAPPDPSTTGAAARVSQASTAE